MRRASGSPQLKKIAPAAMLALALIALVRADEEFPGTRVTQQKREFVDLSRFNMARGMFESEGGMGEAYYAYDGRVWARWETDFPEGDLNFARRLEQLSSVAVRQNAFKRPLSAPDLGDFPFLFMTDPGWMVLSDEEVAGMRGYLERGGFVWMDDFWGDAEWQQFADVMSEVLPDRTWRVIGPEHPIFHTVFDLHEMPQIPALPFAMRGAGTAEFPGSHKYPAGSTEVAQMRGWFDDTGRLMVVATHNTDCGDGFEREAYGEWYFETFSTKAYMLGVNIVTYALTH